MQELAPALRRQAVTIHKGVTMQDLVNRMKPAQDLTQQLMVRL
jgi:hypothetical protein